MRYGLFVLAALTGLISAGMLILIIYTAVTGQFHALPLEFGVFAFFTVITAALIFLAKKKSAKTEQKFSGKDVGIAAVLGTVLIVGGAGVANTQREQANEEIANNSISEAMGIITTESETTTTTESTTASTTTTETTTTTTTTTTETTTTTTTAMATTETTTATTTTTTTTVKAELSITYICNTNSMKFHYPSCSSVPKISSQNRADSWQTREELIAMGYDPCGNCHP